MNTESELTEASPKSGADTSRNARWLFVSSVGAVIVVCVYYSVTSKLTDTLLLLQGVGILLLAATPGLLWAKSGGRNLPLFEVLMLTGANTYAIPLLSGHESLATFTSEQITYAGFTVIVYQLMALFVYYTVKPLPGRSSFFTQEVIERDINRYIGYGLTLTTVYTYFSTFTEIIPPDLTSILRAVFFGIGLVSVFVQSRRWGLGTLAHEEKVVFVVNLAVQVVFLFSGLFLVGGLSLLVLALLGHVSGSRRLPIVFFSVFLVVLGLLHNGKSQMRDRYWDADGTRHQPKLTELPQFFAEWIEYSLTTVPGEGDNKAITAKLLDRTSLFHLLLFVQSQTPEKKPFLDGATYEGIASQFVPRVFWPNKPLGHAATSKMSVYYGLQREEDTGKTTIGFGMLIEAYVNFGLLGMAAFGALMGAFYKFVQGRCRDSPLMSFGGLFTVVLMAWSFQTESPLSMWLSSMFQACVAVMGLPFLLRSFLR